MGEGRASAEALPPGVSMVTAHPPNDLSSPRTARHLPRFRAAADPAPPDWGDWPRLVADGAGSAAEALCVPPIGGFGTVCSSLIHLSEGPEWLFSPGPPDRVGHAPLALA